MVKAIVMAGLLSLMPSSTAIWGFCQAGDVADEGWQCAVAGSGSAFDRWGSVSAVTGSTTSQHAGAYAGLSFFCPWLEGSLETSSLSIFDGSRFFAYVNVSSNNYPVGQASSQVSIDGTNRIFYWTAAPNTGCMFIPQGW